MNTSNCATCVHRVQPPNNAHCWRFKNEPTTKCRQWTHNVLPTTTPIKRIALENTQ